MKKYHSLVSQRDGGSWAIEFGDYSKAVVKQELADTKERGVKYRIITTGDRQADIDAAVAKLNEAPASTRAFIVKHRVWCLVIDPHGRPALVRGFKRAFKFATREDAQAAIDEMRLAPATVEVAS